MPTAPRAARRYILHPRSLRHRLALFTAALLIILTGFIPLILSQQTTSAAVGDWDWQERTSAGSRSWGSITSSADGTKLAATVRNGSIYTSQDSGVTWTEQTSAGSHTWTSITSSNDGTKLAAAASWNGSIYSSADSGATWIERTAAGSRYWQSITSSADGTKLAATAFGGYIYTSTDSGATWIERTAAGSRYWQSITSSADGTTLLAGTVDGAEYPYISYDAGITWQELTSISTTGAWYSLAMTPDATTIVAVNTAGSPDWNDGGYIYVSHNSGATWVEITDLERRYWKDYGSGAAVSADGQTIAVVDQYGSNWNNWYGGYIYTSTDGGQTWAEHTEVGVEEWTGITLSADGTKLAASSPYYKKHIYTATQQQPALTIDGTTVSTTNPSSQPTKTISNTPTFTGLGYANGPVTVTVNSDPIICMTIADSNGNWSCTLPSSIPPGNHTVTIQLTNPDNDTVLTIGPYSVHVLGDSTTTKDNNTPLPPNTGLASFTTTSIPFILAGLSLMVAAGLMILGFRR